MLLAGSVAGLARGTDAASALWPTAPVMVVCPTSAGSSADIRTRQLAEYLSTWLGQSLVVDNRPGAATVIGTNRVAAARADGLTLLATFNPAFVAGPLLYRNARYDPLTSFATVGTFSTASPFLVTHPGLPATDLSQFLALARAHPGALRFAHSGTGGAVHLGAELLRRAADVEFFFVPYRSESDSLADLMAGRVDASFYWGPVALPQVARGKLRALAFAGAERSPALPLVQTIQEGGIGGYAFGVEMMLLGPAGLSPRVVDRLSAALGSALAEPSLRAHFAATGAQALLRTPAQTTTQIARELRIWSELVRELGLPRQ